MRRIQQLSMVIMMPDEFIMSDCCARSREVS